MSLAPVAAPRVVFGMTLHNNARHLPEAAASILDQHRRDFVLLMLDDGSTDDTPQVARAIADADPRVRYIRRETRQGMIATWHEVAATAAREYPSAPYFAWASDHDRWAPRWLDMLIPVLDTDPAAVLVYPATLRIDDAGELGDKEPRVFDTAGVSDPAERWRRFCWSGTGSGDMVYGLIRTAALLKAGIFRPVLNPDRLLVAELCLQGTIRQVETPLWFRRQAGIASIARQRHTLFADAPPAGFWMPPAFQHARSVWREYRTPAPPVRLGTLTLASMVLLYPLSSAWRAWRKTAVSKSAGRGVDNLHWVKKVARKGVHHAVYYTLVGARALRGRLRRLGRRAVYQAAILTHRAGLRGSRGPRIP